MFKNDIKQLPFEEIYPRVVKLGKEKQEELLDLAKKNLAAKNKRKIAQVSSVIARNFDSEAGSDGIEEEAYESLSLTDPEDLVLSDDDKLVCNLQAKDEILDKFIRYTNIDVGYSWAFPQMITYFGNEWTAALGSDGLYDGDQTYKINTEGNNFAKGIWAFATYTRKNLLKLPEGTKNGDRLYKLNEYNALVPIIMWGFKKFQHIPYSKWNRDSVARLVDKELYETMTTELPKLTEDEVLALRQHGLTIASGTKKGQMRSPVSGPALSHMDGYFDVNYNKLSLAILSQTWLAHPANRHQRAQILDPSDWDNVPAPILDATVLKKEDSFWKAPTTNKKTTTSLDW